MECLWLKFSLKIVEKEIKIWNGSIDALHCISIVATFNHSFMFYVQKLLIYRTDVKPLNNAIRYFWHQMRLIELLLSIIIIRMLERKWSWKSFQFIIHFITLSYRFRHWNRYMVYRNNQFCQLNQFIDLAKWRMICSCSCTWYLTAMTLIVRSSNMIQRSIFVQ